MVSGIVYNLRFKRNNFKSVTSRGTICHNSKNPGENSLTEAEAKQLIVERNKSKLKLMFKKLKNKN